VLVDDGCRRTMSCQGRQEVDHFGIEIGHRHRRPPLVVALPRTNPLPWFLCGQEPGEDGLPGPPFDKAFDERQDALNPRRCPRRRGCEQALHIDAQVHAGVAQWSIRQSGRRHQDLENCGGIAHTDLTPWVNKKDPLCMCLACVSTCQNALPGKREAPYLVPRASGTDDNHQSSPSAA
jgi:hypothetical protein